MIVQELYDYYKALSERPGSNMPKPGFASAKVAFVFNLSPDGELLDVIPLGGRRGKRIATVDMEVPEPVKRTSGIEPSFLCDNNTYITGDDEKSRPDRSLQAFEASKELHLSILQDVDDDAARAVCRYFLRWDPHQTRQHPALQHLIEDVLSGRNIVFRLDGSEGFVHDRPKVKEAWLEYRRRNVSGVVSQCLVTGEEAPIARIHPPVKGVFGAQSAGAALSSYNLSSFESYGKTKNYNAPISEAAAFGYTTALNYLLASDRQRLQLDSNTTVVFWSERLDESREEDLMAQLLGLPGEEGQGQGASSGGVEDYQTTQLVRDVLDRVRRGQPINFDQLEVDPDARFFMLGLSPNSSRLSVRFWHVDSFGRMVERVAQHHADMSIVPPRYRPQGIVSVTEVLTETAPRRDRKRIPPLLGGGLMRAILSGQSYPQGLYTALIARIRADGEVNYVRAAMIKAILLRRLRAGWYPGRASTFESGEVTIGMSLDVNNKNSAYLLGRLFATLEKVQEDANPGINATIRDRYFGAASATPRSVFPQLLRLAQHHIAKAQYGRYYDQLIGSIMAELDKFPANLNLGEQGLFMLGYYHQRQSFYEKSSGEE